MQGTGKQTNKLQMNYERRNNSLNWWLKINIENAKRKQITRIKNIVILHKEDEQGSSNNRKRRGKGVKKRALGELVLRVIFKEYHKEEVCIQCTFKGIKI